MSQKKIDNLSQNEPSQDQSNGKLKKTDSLDFYRNNGIPSEDITHENFGQTTLMFTNRTKPPVEDDSLESSIRYLKFKRFNP
jgi:hypothetical protein